MVSKEDEILCFEFYGLSGEIEKGYISKDNISLKYEKYSTTNLKDIRPIEFSVTEDQNDIRNNTSTNTKRQYISII